MSRLRGEKEFEKFQSGEKLTKVQSMKAKCYDCNGGKESNVDCGCDTCPMFQYRLYPNKNDN